jgi:hypothetical protein
VSSILVLRQRNAVHLMADAASYDLATGILRGNNLAKCIALPTISAAISCTGPADLGVFLGDQLAQSFSSFDDLVARAEECLPEFFESFADDMRDGDVVSTIYLIGWHTAQERPAAYCMNCWTDDSSRIAQVMENSPNDAKPEHFRLSEQIFAGTPLPGADLIAAASLKFPADVNDVDPELDLLHVMEIQRHEEIEGHFWVGGKAMLTSIDRRGITQRVVHHWIEDKIDQPIRPLPIDFAQWRAARKGLPKTVSIMSKLQRWIVVRRVRKLERWLETQ